MRDEEVTQEDVEALFESGEETESEEETGVGEEPAEETSEEDTETEPEEESEEEGEPEGDEPLNWDELDPRYKAAFEKAAKDAEHWQKTHGKLQSEYTKTSKAQKEFEQNLERYRERESLLTRFEEVFESSPRLQQALKEELARQNDPFGSVEVPDYLKQDPAYEYMQKAYAPVLKSLQSQLQELKQKTGKIDEYEQQKSMAARQERLNGLVSDAKAQIQSMLGREASEEDVKKVMQYMVDNKYYQSGKAAALAVFSEDYEKAIQTKHAEKMREKARKLPPRSKGVNPGRVSTAPKHATTAEEAIAMALSEQGY